MPATPFMNTYCIVFSPKFKRGVVWRKVRDSNPRTLAGLQFSRLVPSTTLPTFRVKIAEKIGNFYSVLRFYKF